MTYDEQLRITALVNKLIYTEGTIFETADALELSALLPMQKKNRFYVSVIFKNVFSKFKGFFSGLTNTGHKISLEEDEPKYIRKTSEQFVWVGKFELLQTKDKHGIGVTIQDKFFGTKSDLPNYHRLILEYNKFPRLYKMIWKTYSLGFITFSKAKRGTYKEGTEIFS